MSDSVVRKDFLDLCNQLLKDGRLFRLVRERLEENKEYTSENILRHMLRVLTDKKKISLGLEQDMSVKLLGKLRLSRLLSLSGTLVVNRRDPKLTGEYLRWIGEMRLSLEGDGLSLAQRGSQDQYVLIEALLKAAFGADSGRCSNVLNKSVTAGSLTDEAA